MYQRTTLERMQKACAAVSRGDSIHRTFIEACAEAADELATEYGSLGRPLDNLAANVEANSRRWFPNIYDEQRQPMPLPAYMALALSGEVGELCNYLKKQYRWKEERSYRDEITAELADSFTYLLLLSKALDIDLEWALMEKQRECAKRWDT